MLKQHAPLAASSVVVAAPSSLDVASVHPPRPTVLAPISSGTTSWHDLQRQYQTG